MHGQEKGLTGFMMCHHSKVTLPLWAEEMGSMVTAESLGVNWVQAAHWRVSILLGKEVEALGCHMTLGKVLNLSLPGTYTSTNLYFIYRQPETGSRGFYILAGSLVSSSRGFSFFNYLRTASGASLHSSVRRENPGAWSVHPRIPGWAVFAAVVARGMAVEKIPTPYGPLDAFYCRDEHFQVQILL